MESLKQPLVSVIVPCYNHAQYLPDALGSVLAQTYSNWECIVVNDCSPDDTRVVAEQWMAKDARFKLVNAEKNGGLAASRNLGIRHSTGEYILPLDADDAIHANFLKLTTVALDDTSIKVVYTDAQEFGDSNNHLRFEPFTISDLCHGNKMHCTSLFRRIDYANTDGYRINMKYGYEDWDFWIQMLTNDAKVFHIKEPLFLVRKKADSMYTYLVRDTTKESAMRKQIYENNRPFFDSHKTKTQGLWAIALRILSKKMRKLKGI